MPQAPFDFVVIGVLRTPQTSSAKSRQDWKAKVREAAEERWPGKRPPFVDEVRVAIVYFYEKATSIDVDNIDKLILDALVGLVIEDDRIVSQVLVRKTNQVGLEIIEPPATLLGALGRFPSFVYVRVSDPPNHRELPE